MITLNEQTRGLSLVKEVIKYYATGKGALSLTAGVVYGFVRTRPGLETPDMQFHMAPCQLRYGAEAAAREGTRHDRGDRPVPARFARLDPHQVGDARRRARDPAELPVGPDRPRRHGRGHADRPQDRARIRRSPKYIAYENNPGDKVQSYDEWLDFARRTGQTTYHVVGTCKMGSDPMAVVDDRLRVHGIAGLRVIDASIMPTVPSGNTNAPTIMVAEKGADMIKEDAKVGLRAAA